MSKAFVTDNDPWEYCVKAGERCVMAEQGRKCYSKDCEFAEKPEALPDERQSSENKDI